MLWRCTRSSLSLLGCTRCPYADDLASRRHWKPCCCLLKRGPATVLFQDKLLFETLVPSFLTHLIHVYIATILPRHLILHWHWCLSDYQPCSVLCNGLPAEIAHSKWPNYAKRASKACIPETNVDVRLCNLLDRQLYGLGIFNWLSACCYIGTHRGN